MAGSQIVNTIKNKLEDGLEQVPTTKPVVGAGLAAGTAEGEVGSGIVGEQVLTQVPTVAQTPVQQPVVQTESIDLATQPIDTTPVIEGSLVMPETQGASGVEQVPVQPTTEQVNIEQPQEDLLAGLDTLLSGEGQVVEEPKITMAPDVVEDNDEEQVSMRESAGDTIGSMGKIIGTVIHDSIVDYGLQKNLTSNIPTEDLLLLSSGNDRTGAPVHISDTMVNANNYLNLIDTDALLTPSEKATKKEEYIQDKFKGKLDLKKYNEINDKYFKPALDKYQVDRENKIMYSSMSDSLRSTQKLVSQSAYDMGTAYEKQREESNQRIQKNMKNLAFTSNTTDYSNIDIGLGTEKMSRDLINNQEKFQDMVVSQQSKLDTSKDRMTETQYVNAEKDIAVNKDRVDSMLKRQEELAMKLYKNFLATGDEQEAQELTAKQIRNEGFQSYEKFLYQDNPQEASKLKTFLGDSSVVGLVKKKLKGAGTELDTASMGAYEYEKKKQLEFARQTIKGVNIKSIMEGLDRGNEAATNTLTDLFKSGKFQLFLEGQNYRGAKSDMPFLDIPSYTDDSKAGLTRKMGSFFANNAPEAASAITMFMATQQAGKLADIGKVENALKSMKIPTKGAMVLSRLAQGVNETAKGQMIGGIIQANLPNIYNDTSADVAIDLAFSTLDVVPALLKSKMVVNLYSNLTREGVDKISNTIGRPLLDAEIKEINRTYKGLESMMMDMYKEDPNALNTAMKNGYARKNVEKMLGKEGLQTLNTKGWDALRPEQKDKLSTLLASYKSELANPNVNVADMMLKDVPVVIGKNGDIKNPSLIKVGPFEASDEGFGRLTLRATNDVTIPKELEKVGVTSGKDVYTKEEADFIMKGIGNSSNPETAAKSFDTVFKETDEGEYVFKDAGSLGIEDNRTPAKKIANRVEGYSKTEENFFKSIKQVADETGDMSLLKKAAEYSDSGVYDKTYKIINDLICN